MIGRDNGLPWHLPADLRHFKAVTLGKPIVMGRRTHESIGRALPGRHNIVVTRQRDYVAAGCTVAASIAAAIAACGDVDEAMVIGGGELYRALLPRCDAIYLTLVHSIVDGDAFFPELDPADWREIERVDHEADDKNAYPYSFILKERVRG